MRNGRLLPIHRLDGELNDAPIGRLGELPDVKRTTAAVTATCNARGLIHRPTLVSQLAESEGGEMAEEKKDAGPAAVSEGPWNKHSSRIVGSIAVATFGLGTVVYHILEDWSWVDSFYFSVVALTTVGFGDLSPTTDASKLFTVFYLLIGVSLIGLVLNELLKRRAKTAGQRVAAKATDSDK